MQKVVLDESVLAVNERAADLVALDEALVELAALDERLSKVVELRFFGGLSVEETAQMMNVSPRTIKRDWRKAKAFLYKTVSEKGPA